MKNKTGLAIKFKDMLKDLFDDISGDSFSYTADDNILHLLKYCLSEKDNKAYFQIISADSEARAAQTLSSIRENITKGKHRKDFLIICSYDGASLSYCCRLMKPIGIFERHLRELMYLITTKAFGVDWVEKTFPKEMINGIKERTYGNLNDEKITESAFQFLNYDEVITYLFSKRYFGCSPEELIEERLSVQSLSNLSREEIIATITSHRKTTLWDKLFSNINGFNKKTIDKIRKYRNDVMHHHELNNTYFKDIRKEVQAADKIIIQAIVNIENKIYTEEESKIVFSSIGYAITEMMKAINFTAKLNIPDITSSISRAVKNLEDRCNDLYSKINFPTISKTLYDSLCNMPDYSKLIDINKNIDLPFNNLHWMENMPDMPKSNENEDEDEDNIES